MTPLEVGGVALVLVAGVSLLAGAALIRHDRVAAGALVSAPGVLACGLVATGAGAHPVAAFALSALVPALVWLLPARRRTAPAAEVERAEG